MATSTAANSGPGWRTSAGRIELLELLVDVHVPLGRLRASGISIEQEFGVYLETIAPRMAPNARPVRDLMLLSKFR
jgi:hypothetical protein